MKSYPLPAVFWFTGLSGAGKTTIAQQLYRYFNEKGYEAEYLDGDEIRALFPGTGYSKEERNDHIKRIGFLASRLEKHGAIVIASFISPYKEGRDFARSLCKNFIEIHVSTPLEICESRDVKGLYKKARAGEIKHFTGIDDPYEAPVSPDIIIDTSSIETGEAVDLILKRIV